MRQVSGKAVRQVAAEHFEGVLGGPEADAFAVSGDVELFDLGIFAVGEGDVDEADGLVGVEAAGSCGAGDAGDAEGEGAAGAAADAFGERACDCVRDGAVFVDEVGGNVGEGGLAAVGVSDGAAEEDARTVGDGGEALTEQAAGAAFGDSEGLAADAEHEQDDFLEGLAVEARRCRRPFRGHQVGDGFDAGFGFGEGVLDADEVELDLGVSLRGWWSGRRGYWL